MDIECNWGITIKEIVYEIASIEPLVDKRDFKAAMDKILRIRVMIACLEKLRQPLN